MATGTLSYSQLGDQHSWSGTVGALLRGLRLPRWKAHEGKALASVDRSDASLKARIGELEAQLARAESLAASHRADFERERERCDQLTMELMRTNIETMNVKEAAARLEGELTALRSLPWWRRLAG